MTTRRLRWSREDRRRTDGNQNQSFKADCPVYVTVSVCVFLGVRMRTGATDVLYD